MKALTTLLILILLSGAVCAQTARTDERAVRSIANLLIKDTVYGFVDKKTGQIYSQAKDAPVEADLRLLSDYTTWRYTNGVINLGMLQAAAYLKDDTYKNFVLKNIAFAFDNVPVLEARYKGQPKSEYPLARFFLMQELDDCGSMCSSVIEAFQYDKRKDYQDYIQKTAGHVSTRQQRLPDGTLVRANPFKMTLWADDLYMSISFLARMGKYFGETKYFDDAVRQVVNFHKYLYDKNDELYYHYWYDDLKRPGPAYWGRENGWILLAKTALLSCLPPNYPGRDSVLALFEEQMLGIARYQGPQGLWHQVLDKTDSYLESSCTAMFTYSIAKAVNEGWVDRRYATIALRGWDGLKTKIRDDGQIEDICVGTGTSADLVFYYNRPARLNDDHGIGAALLAGIEIMKLQENLKKR